MNGISMHKTREMAYTALMAAAICALAPFQIPVGPVPVTLATFAVYVAAATLGAGRGAAAVALYIALGAIGLPVFSGFSGGLPKLFGPTGGYIAGYLPCAAVTGFFADWYSRRRAAREGGAAGEKRGAARSRRPWMYAAGMALGTVLCYTVGTAWFVYQRGVTWGAALAICALPFLPFDAVKIVAASAISPVIRARLKLEYG
ncbi:MAG: biotin transporter BioY [Oscillospiraceae bacterium]|jgi:biotin transport system substrate-specific component|nr:biotin transporter BioY [Oscillospiraceae bacterium]